MSGFCEQCGSALGEGAQFCAACGTKVPSSLMPDESPAAPALPGEPARAESSTSEAVTARTAAYLSQPHGEVAEAAHTPPHLPPEPGGTADRGPQPRSTGQRRWLALASILVAGLAGASAFLSWFSEVNAFKAAGWVVSGAAAKELQTRGIDTNAGKALLVLACLGVLCGITSARISKTRLRVINLVLGVGGVASVVLAAANYEPRAENNWHTSSLYWVALGVAVAWAVIAGVASVGSSYQRWFARRRDPSAGYAESVHSGGMDEISADAPTGILSKKSRKGRLFMTASVIAIAIAAIVIAAAAGVLPGTSRGEASSKPKARPLPAGGRQYASDMRTTFSFGRGVGTRDLATFGKQVCYALGAGSSVANEVPTARASWSHTSPGDAIQMITLATQDMCPAQQTAQTVTYVVSDKRYTGLSQVTYGPSGSNHTGSDPMSVTRPLGNPSYYAIDAQLQGYGGTVRCELEVDGVTISAASASGGYNIASCEIGQDPTTGSWEDLNSG